MPAIPPTTRASPRSKTSSASAANRLRARSGRSSAPITTPPLLRLLFMCCHPGLLHVADDGLDCGPAAHLAANGGGDAAHLAADPDAELVRVVMAAITLVDMNAAGLDAGEFLHVLDHRSERMAVERVAVQRFGVEHELAAPGRRRGRGNRYLATELVGCVRLALADAFDFRCVEGIDLGAALPVILMPHFNGEIEEVGKAGLEGGFAVDLPADVADDAAEPRAEELERLAGALELMGMAVSPDHEGGALGDAQIALAQRHRVAPGERDELHDRSMHEPRVGRMRDRLRLHRGVDHHPLEILGLDGAGLVRHR